MDDEYIKTTKACLAAYQAFAKAPTSIHDIMKAIEAIPGEDVRPIERGKWVDKNRFESNNHFQMWTCSCCGYVRSSNWSYEKSNKPTANYCESCGAEMNE